MPDSTKSGYPCTQELWVTFGAITPADKHALRKFFKGPLQPLNMTLNFPQRGIKASTLGITPPLQIRCGETTFAHKFVAMQMQEELDCLVGLDIFGKCGFAISNVPAAYPVIVAKHEETPAAEANEPLDEVRDEEYEVLLKTSLADVLKENQQTASKFCNLNEAVVHLDTGKHSPSWVKQYRIPIKLQETFDETVNSWLQKEVITHAPVGCTWNSPILAVPKKDV